MMPSDESSKSVMVSTRWPSSWVTDHGNPSMASGWYRMTTLHSLLVVTPASLRGWRVHDLNAG